MNKIIPILFVVGLASLWFLHMSVKFEYADYVIAGSAILGGLVIAFMAFRLSHIYSRTKCTGQALTFLAIAFICYAVAEMIWFQFYLEDIEPYPSMADIMYAGYFIFTIAFLWTVFKTFIKEHSPKVHMVLILFVGIIISGYLFISYVHEAELINLGLIFIGLSSFITIVSIIIAIRMHVRNIKTLWIIIAIVMTLNGVGDMWYYTIDNIGDYTYGHILDTLWFASDILLISFLLVYQRYEKSIE